MSANQASLHIETVDQSWTVNDVTRCFPESMVVLNELGIDTCCGGTKSLGIAAAGINLPVNQLIALLSTPAK